MIAISEIDIGMPWFSKHNRRTLRESRLCMTGEIFLTDVGFSFGNQTNQLHVIQNPNEPRTDEFARNSQGGAVVEGAGKGFYHGVHGVHRKDEFI